MSQAPCRSRFAFETLDEFLVAHQLGSDQFERHVALRAEVGREIDGAHAALAEQSLQKILFVEHLTDVMIQAHHVLRMLTAGTVNREQ